VPVRATECRPDIFAIEWHEDTWDESPVLSTNNEPLFLAELVVERADTASVHFVISAAGSSLRLQYQPTARNQAFFSGTNAEATAASVTVGDETMPLTDYLCATPPRFHAVGGGFLEGGQWLAPRLATRLDFPRDRLEEWNWAGVDIQKEARPSLTTGLVNVQARVEAEVQRTSGASFIFNDDGSGELADLVVIEEAGGGVEVTLYHCKYSAEPTAGARVKDLYEVCGQGLKSARRRRKEDVVTHLQRRFASGRAVRGDLIELARLERLHSPWRFRVVLVQPGVSKAGVSDFMLEILAGTDGYLVGQGFEPSRFVCSP
jgi:hypothetical protein